MAVTIVLVISLAAVLQPSAGQPSDFTSLSTRDADQQKEIVDTHNNFRRSVKPEARNMLKMEWSDTAAENARLWAQECTLSHSQRDRRTINAIGCGENIYMSSAVTPWSKVIWAWFNEKKDFKYGYGSVTGAVTGHYTQVVWYRSYLLGCFVAHCPQGRFRYYYVCHYCPGGNIVGSINTPYKLGIPCGDCPDNCDNGLCTNPCRYGNIYSNCPQLKQSPGCEDPMVKEKCKASCQCTHEIK